MFFLGFLWQLPSLAQEASTAKLFLDVPFDTLVVVPDSPLVRYQLPDRFLIPRSERIYLNRFKLLPGIHYRLSDRSGLLQLITPVPAGDSLKIIYQKYPFPLISEYYHRALKKAEAPDSVSGEPTAFRSVTLPGILEDLDQAGANLQRSGSIVRGVEIGNNRDLTLNSGLNLQLSGYLTPEVRIVAALTDESTPIQPEGNTQTLQEVDKVFVRIESPHLGGTVGDFNLTYGGSSFGNFTRKLQGVSARGNFGAYRGQITYATTRGTFHTNQFLGQEGKQGPYQLVGKNGEREIIVLAGTEKVYVNGILQVRGENNDYIIDYSLGQITFTNKRLITGEDRIEVDFEYADTYQRYGKSLLGISARGMKLGRALDLDLRLFREWDDTRNLLEDSTPLTDEEKEALRNAGDDPLKAAVSGVSYVGEGKGNYTKADTLIEGQSYDFYRYVGTGKGEYLVRFTGVGRGKGSYLKERLGVYRFVGPNKGEYLPIKLVPLAKDQRLMDLGLNLQLGKNFSLRSELAVSDLDKNVFSDLDNGDNLGQAMKIAGNYNNPRLTLAGRHLGTVLFNVNWRHRQVTFAPLDRQVNPEYSYRWNLGENRLIGDETALESNLIYQPHRRVRLVLEGGKIEQGSALSSQRGRGELVLPDSSFLAGRFLAENVRSADSLSRSEWFRWRGSLGRWFWKLFPYLKIYSEDRRSRQNSRPHTGFKFTEYTAGMQISHFLRGRWSLQSRLRDDYLYDPENDLQLLYLSASRTHQLNYRIQPGSNWQGRVSFIYRSKQYSEKFRDLPSDSIPRYQPDPQFQDTTWQDRQSYLANLEIRFRNRPRTVDSRWDYKVASELTALREKVFLEVGENRGNYRYDPTLGEYVPDPQGNFLLVVVPTGNYEPATRIEAGWQFRYRPKTARKKKRGLANLLQKVSFVSYLKVEEQSRYQDIWRLFILDWSKFHNAQTTLQGSYVANQDLYLFERNPNFGLQFRSRFRDNISNSFVDVNFNERRRFWEKSLKWRQRWKNKKFTHELEYKNVLNRRTVSSSPTRNRDVVSNILAGRFNFRPVYAWQFQFGLEFGLEKDRDPGNPMRVRYLQLQPQINFAMRSKARLIANASLLRVDILDNPLNRPIPYEMGKGKKEGWSYLWTFRFEYFLNRNVTISANYDGRQDAGMVRPLHLARAEVRAFF